MRFAFRETTTDTAGSATAAADTMVADGTQSVSPSGDPTAQDYTPDVSGAAVKKKLTRMKKKVPSAVVMLIAFGCGYILGHKP